MKVSTNQINIFGSNKDNDNKNIEAVFMEYDGDERCVRCCYAEKKKRKYCEKAPCTPDERKDKKTGYFRRANSTKIERTYTLPQ